MIDISYAEVEPLLASAVQEGEVLRCTFRCPASGEEAEGRAPLIKGRTLEDVSTVEAPGLLDGLRDAFGALFGGAVGGRGPGAGTAEADAPQFTESERKAAALVAFDGVSSRFVRDGVTGRWLAASGAGDLLSDFARQLGMAPIRREHDRAIAARILVEVARADGQVTPTEWKFLAQFVPVEVSSVDACMELPALTAEDLDQASGGAARETMLMLAWALAFIDSDLDLDETHQLLTYARGLKIPEPRAFELRGYAQEHLLEEALRLAYRRGKVNAPRREEARGVGRRVGLDEPTIAAVEERLERRLGLR